MGLVITAQLQEAAGLTATLSLHILSSLRRELYCTDYFCWLHVFLKSLETSTAKRKINIFSDNFTDCILLTGKYRMQFPGKYCIVNLLVLASVTLFYEDFFLFVWVFCWIFSYLATADLNEMLILRYLTCIYRERRKLMLDICKLKPYFMLVFFAAILWSCKISTLVIHLSCHICVNLQILPCANFLTNILFKMCFFHVCLTEKNNWNDPMRQKIVLISSNAP